MEMNMSCSIAHEPVGDTHQIAFTLRRGCFGMAERGNWWYLQGSTALTPLFGSLDRGVQEEEALSAQALHPQNVSVESFDFLGRTDRQCHSTNAMCLHPQGSNRENERPWISILQNIPRLNHSRQDQVS